MKVTVSKYLNVRVGAPSVNSPNYQYLAPGSVIEVDGKLYEGDNYDGNSIWYKDVSNNYYWSGGLTITDTESNVPHHSQEIAFDQTLEVTDFNFSEELKKSVSGIPNGNGKAITIAILDSGIETNFLSIRSKIIKQKNYQSGREAHPHATQVAGFLVASNNKLIGLCPESEILDLRVSNNNGNTVPSAVVAALKDILEWNKTDNNPFCDIINLSLDVDFEFPELQKCIDGLVEQGVLILVAGTQRSRLNSIAKLNGVIPVGTFMGFQFNELKQTGFFKEVVINFLNKSIISTYANLTYKPFGNSSAFTALTTGLVSKFLSAQMISKSERKSKVLAFLKSLAVSIKEETSVKSLKPYKS